MDDPTLLNAWLALIRAPGLGIARLRGLLEASGKEDATALIGRPAGRLRAWGASERIADALSRPDNDLIEADRAWLGEAPDRHLITLTDSRFPDRLKSIADPPLALFALGDPDLLALPQLAMVGSRNPTTGGRRTALEFSRHLAASGLTITSGLAEGIDTAAHLGALEADGMTIGITGTGLDRVYPAANRQLAHDIAATGLLISEFAPGTPPRSGHFPRRNRLIAGLSLGVLVVEATERSGSLITARLGAEYGREVFAIPGSIHNPMARGCHRLIRQGAKLVETAADILEELAPLLPSSAAAKPPPSAIPDEEPLDGDYQALLDAMGFDPVTVDDLVGLSGLTAEAVSSMLLLLELRGHVEAAPGGRYGRIRPQPRGT